MKKAISKNKFLGAICSIGLVLIIGCVMLLTACGVTYTTGEMRLGMGAPYGFTIDSSELTLTAVAPEEAAAGETNFGIKVTGAVEELSTANFAQLYLTANDLGNLVVIFTLTITQEMMDDADSVIIIDDCYKTDAEEDTTLTQSYELNTAGVVDSLPTFDRDGYIYVICNTAGDAISHVTLEWTPTDATEAVSVNYVIDFTDITKKLVA